jgi:VanZ family protein
LLLAASAGDEFLQALLPWRVGSLPDVAFNVVSAFGSYALVRYHRRKTLVV